ncbi:hypothetical protein K435DRAFT_784134 [Dendrothele bispora CBS 962.96]|uniref:Uncharacterized protein n=1 Tax=Dendrothele bispora (strain CBS 962.96) TaxID=1314807 RepID=A0A4S8L4Q4_DENBC|nr:hypothetical protein K435DRAFT_784134 [Dendrothele bispora CBS 962.96]
MVSTRGPPAGIIHLDRLPSLRRLGLTAVLSGLQDNTTQNLISGLAQFFEISNTNTTEITHLAFGFSFSTTSLVFNPFRVPWWRLDTALAALPTLRWVGVQVIDRRCETSIIIPEDSVNMFPMLSEKGLLHWSTGRLEFPAM